MGKRRLFERGICPWSSTGVKLKLKLKLMETAGGEDIGREKRKEIISGPNEVWGGGFGCVLAVGERRSGGVETHLKGLLSLERRAAHFHHLSIKVMITQKKKIYIYINKR